MKVNEVSLAELIDITHKNWGCNKDRSINGPYVATTLDILFGGDMASTSNIEGVAVIAIWNPFCNWDRKSKKNKLVGYYTLKEKDMKEVFKLDLEYSVENMDECYKAYLKSKRRLNNGKGKKFA